MKGHGPSSCSDVDDVIGLLESIADDGKVGIPSSYVDSTIEMIAFATTDMLSIYQRYPEMLFMDGIIGMAHVVYFIG